MENSKRIFFLDNIRIFIIFLVITLHVSLAYVPYGGWATDASQMLIGPVSIISTIIDSPILMTPLFFISGYFTLSSFYRKGTRHFITDKLLRIGIPYIAGITIIAYLLANIAYYANGGKGTQVVSLKTFFSWFKVSLNFFAAGYYTQYHFWFIGVLFWFFLIAALVIVIFRHKISPGITSTKKPGPLFFICIFFLNAAITFILSLVWAFTDWTAIYIIQFQNVFLPVYAVYFITGIYAYKRNWFKAGGFMPPAIVWTIFFIVSITAHFLLNVLLYQYNPSTIFQKLVVSVTYNLSMMSFLFMLPAFFEKYLNVGGKFQKAISESAYPAYLIHLFFVFAMVILTRMITIASGFKLVFNIIIATLFSFAAGYGLKKIPGLRKVL